MAFGVSKQDESFREYALTAPPMKVLLTVCGPLALYQALQQIFRVLDSLMAAHISSDAVSAIASLAQITLMITAIGTGLAVGGSIKISEAYGKGDYDQVRVQVATLYALAVMISLVVAGTLIPFARPFLKLMGTPESLIQVGAGYFRVEIATQLVSFFNTVYIAIERSRGHGRRILYLNLAIILIKLGLSALFVYGMDADVVMIAVATLLSQLFLLFYALGSMFRDEGIFRFSVKNIRLGSGTLLPIFKLSYPVSAEKMLFAGGKVVVNAMSKAYGDLTVGALGISNNIGGLTTNWHMGFLDGASALISQNRGAGKYRRTLKLFYCLLALDIAIGAVGLAVVSGCLPWLARVFAQSKSQFDQAFCDGIVAIHRWEMLGYITLGINSAVDALLLGYGYSKATMVLNAARVFVFRVPVLWFFQNFTGLGAEAVGMTMMVSNVLIGVTAACVAIPLVLKIKKMKDT